MRPGDADRVGGSGVGYDPDLYAPLADLEECSFWFRARSRLIVSTFERHFAAATSFLEVGSGTGSVLAALHEHFPHLRLVGGDRYAQGVERARQRVPSAEITELDVRDLPYEGEFDVVGAFDVLEHVDEDERALSQMVRAARPGGGIFILVPQHPWLWSRYDELGGHVRRYTRRDLLDKAQRVGIAPLAVSSFVSTLLPALAAFRLVDRFWRRSDPVAGLHAGRLNAAFECMLDGERRLIERGVSLPVGGSLMLVGRKR